MRNTIFIILLGLFLMTLWGACKKDIITTSTPTTQDSVTTKIQGYSLVIVSGSYQVDTIYSQLNTPLKVQTLDSLGLGIEGVEVVFSVSRGDGTLSVDTTITGIDGFSEVVWTLGSYSSINIITVTGNVTIPPRRYNKFYAYGIPIGGGIYDQCPPIFGSITDSRDGEVYETVTICNQKWMAENLRYDAPAMTGALDTVNPANPNSKYGRLYNWTAIMNGELSSASNPSGRQGLCPNGWHVPSDSEWNELEMALGMPAEDTARSSEYYEPRSGDHAIFMLSTTGWSNWTGGTNSSGFNILPAGYYAGDFVRLNEFAAFLTTTKEYTHIPGAPIWIRDFGAFSVSRRFSTTGSCRCVED
jgi:uncharacterized protein (TIGR02145 family)